MVKNNLGEKAKRNLITFARLCDDRLEKYWNEEIKNNFGFNETQKSLVKKVLLHTKEHNLRSAKRARAGFVWYGYMLGDVGDRKGATLQEEKIWKVCEGVELVHTALLMHDDFMDRDKVRRGKPTTQEIFAEGDAHYGDSMAVNIGDAVLCLGFERVLASGFEDKKINLAMKKMLRGIANTAYGQAYDVSLSKIIDFEDPTTLKLCGASEKVMSLHRAKTAIYTYENPLVIGGILAGVNEIVLEILRKYSEYGGIAFQIQDDILGVYGDEEKTGKSNNSDLLQGKVTLLIVKTLELGTTKQREDLLKVWGKGVDYRSSMIDSRDIELAKEAIKESGACEYSVGKARELAQLAVVEARKLRELELNIEAVDYLEGIAEYMVDRRS